ncbi:hypothetical protein AB0G74_03485 [Streptomyces sp. NPDC020875]|uniref:hypothetical protein n=1 Tax=Streptomyces sp. NPDC020875 TaxID=3154898 RepID=UPI0033DCBFBB
MVASKATAHFPAVFRPTLDPPSPVPGCTLCAALVVRRGRARAAGDLSRVTDCDVLLRRHPGHEPFGQSLADSGPVADGSVRSRGGAAVDGEPDADA